MTGYSPALNAPLVSKGGTKGDCDR